MAVVGADPTASGSEFLETWPAPSTMHAGKPAQACLRSMVPLPPFMGEDKEVSVPTPAHHLASHAYRSITRPLVLSH